MLLPVPKPGRTRPANTLSSYSPAGRASSQMTFCGTFVFPTKDTLVKVTAGRPCYKGPMFLDAAWILIRILNWGGLVVALACVAIFGWHFVRINAATARGETNEVPPSSWRGPRAKLGFLMVGIGAAMQITSIILAAVIPGRH